MFIVAKRMDEAGTWHVLPFWQPSLLHVRFENSFCVLSLKNKLLHFFSFDYYCNHFMSLRDRQ